MKIPSLLLVCLLFISLSLNGQKNFIRTYYDKWFPNNLYLKNERLTQHNDSLKNLNDSLLGVQSLAIEKINAFKEEIVDLQGQLLNDHRKLKAYEDSTVLIRKTLTDSIKELKYYIVSCTEQSIQHDKSAFPELINTCYWGDYALIETGKPDIKGRYTWKSALYKSSSENKIEIQPAQLFRQDKIDELVQLINQRLNEDFQTMKETESICFDRKKIFNPFKIDEMRITLSENGGMHFEVNYNLAESCFEVSTASVSFYMKEIMPFLNKD